MEPSTIHGSPIVTAKLHPPDTTGGGGGGAAVVGGGVGAAVVGGGVGAAVVGGGVGAAVVGGGVGAAVVGGGVGAAVVVGGGDGGGEAGVGAGVGPGGGAGVPPGPVYGPSYQGVRYTAPSMKSTLGQMICRRPHQQRQCRWWPRATENRATAVGAMLRAVLRAAWAGRVAADHYMHKEMVLADIQYSASHCALNPKTLTVNQSLSTMPPVSPEFAFQSHLRAPHQRRHACPHTLLLCKATRARQAGGDCASVKFMAASGVLAHHSRLWMLLCLPSLAAPVFCM